MKVQWLPEAIETRNAQIIYIAKDSAQAARLVSTRLRDQIRQLVHFPGLGRAGRRPGTRELVISRTPLVVVYRVRPKLARLEIIRVLHSSQQWPPERQA